MKMLNAIVIICATVLTTSLYAQQLSVKGKTVQVEDLPEYIVVNCDNKTSFLNKTIRIVIQSKNSAYEKPLKDLQEMLEEDKYLKVSNQTDLLNTMAQLGYDFLDAFSENSNEGSSFSRSGFVFRKKEKYRT